MLNSFEAALAMKRQAEAPAPVAPVADAPDSARVRVLRAAVELDEAILRQVHARRVDAAAEVLSPASQEAWEIALAVEAERRRKLERSRAALIRAIRQERS